jgi:hypothetical protein
MLGTDSVDVDGIEVFDVNLALVDKLVECGIVIFAPPALLLH